MMEAALSGIWASMSTWLTPTVLFLLVNLVIGTIVITSGMFSNNHQNPAKAQPPHLVRQPSLLERLRSINLHRHVVHETPPTTAQIFVNEETVEELDMDHFEGLEPTLDQHYEKIMSDAKSTLGDQLPVLKATKRIKKSASAKLAIRNLKEGDVVAARGAETVRVGRRRRNVGDDQDEDGEGVDQKADDFINKFKQQLQLQRMESILRNNEMVNRGK